VPKSNWVLLHARGPSTSAPRYGLYMAKLRLFASARETAGTSKDEFAAATVGEVLDAASASYGSAFERLLGSCKVWCNGQPAERTDAVGDTDEVAVLPPVSGGSDPSR